MEERFIRDAQESGRHQAARTYAACVSGTTNRQPELRVSANHQALVDV